MPPVPLAPTKRLTDTSPDVDRLMIDLYRAMTPQQRLDISVKLTELASALALADIRRRHPEADERECLLRLATRRAGPEIIKQLCGWDVAEHGY